MENKNKDWKKTKTIYWSNELNEDFNEIGLSRPPVPKNYPYIRKNFFTVLFSNILYWCIAKPIIGLLVLFSGLRVKGKENLRKVSSTGAFIYSNHVSLVNDAYKFQIIVPHKRVNIIGYSDSLSVPVVKTLTRALGYLPLPLNNDFDNFKRLSEAINYYYTVKGQYIVIYPEAHVWPYYTHIRNFQSGSFIYPAKCNAPVLPVVTVWRKAKFSKVPKQTIIYLPPIYPDPSKSEAENRIYLHKECLKAMQECSNSYNQEEYIKYIKVEKND